MLGRLMGSASGGGWAGAAEVICTGGIERAGCPLRADHAGPGAPPEPIPLPEPAPVCPVVLIQRYHFAAIPLPELDRVTSLHTHASYMPVKF